MLGKAAIEPSVKLVHFLALTAMKHCCNVCTKLLCQSTALSCLDGRRWVDNSGLFVSLGNFK